MLQLQQPSVGCSMIEVGETITVHGLELTSVTLTAWLALGTMASQVNSVQFWISVAVVQPASTWIRSTIRRSRQG